MSPGMAGGFFTKTPSGKPGHHDNICIKHQGSFPLGYLELHSFFFLEEEMATHSSILAWRIPGTGEPGRLLSMGLHRVGHDCSDLAAAAASFFCIIFPTTENIHHNSFNLGICPEYTFHLINDILLLFHILLLQFMSFAHFVSWHKETDACGFNLWELFVPVNRFQHNLSNAEVCHREQGSFSSLAQEELGKQML